MITHFLTSEINEEQITIYIAENNEYAAKITNPRIYKLVQEDVLKRYSNPLDVEFMSHILSESYKGRDTQKNNTTGYPYVIQNDDGTYKIPV